MMCSFFFFSSRRRHTRCGRDWSSDVCSSDLEQIAHAEDQLTRTLEELRRLAHGLHPRVLAEHGLESALAALAKDLPLPVEINVASTQLPQQVAVAAYFVCAEALANVAKHAAASRVAV